MARLHRNVAPQLPRPPVAPVAEWAWLLCQPFAEAQRLLWDAFLGWQQSILTLNKDVSEQWAVRFGGGVPIDG
ncbi:MAG TPA: hypothetical protein VGH48_10265 [Caldimonas sp.]|jgi:hypothetical protein